MFAELWKIFALTAHATGLYASVCGNVPRVWLHFDFIFVVLTRGNVTLNIVIGPFVRMTFHGPFVGIGDVIGLVVGIGPVVGIGLVVSLTIFCHRYLTMKLRHRNEFTCVYFSGTNLRCQRQIVSGSEA